ncbi:MAG: UDP-N-acetylmuramoyl-tripeptide--D-alanyl-D-alanine ligase [Oscillospiraceae bacterium]|nr:UDP-N-acetylmuramoyl-tripeptide--D-alanyl-D-alanine ligase [Oscillospiraceae bacterium]
MKPTKLGVLLQGIAVTKQPDRLISAVTTDSRSITPGCLFVAIVGDRFDGNDFARSALERGAAAALVSRETNCTGEQILVRDTRDALIELAGNYRAQFSPKLVAVTGSVGKTTTKEMTAVILSSFGRTLKSEGNQNNEVGLPSTLLSLTDEIEYAVVEMGMNGLGDISKLPRAARPRAGAITQIGVSHLELLGSRENILKAKLEIIEGLPQDGVLALNGDDEMLTAAREELEIETATFAIFNADSDVVAKDIMTRPMSTEFTIADRANGSFKAMIPCAGNHNVMDALAAYTLTTRIGLDPGKCAAALSDYVPSGMRQKFVDFHGITVIEDCYNASPESMRAALQTLVALPNEGIKVAVLGDMLELGEISRDAHVSIGIEAAKMGIDILLCYGENMKLCAESAISAGIASAVHFDDKNEMADYVSKTLHPGDAVVFKASRAIRMEDVIEKFYAAAGDGETRA